MKETSDAIKSGDQNPINASTITATTIVPTMTTVTIGNGTDVTQIAAQIVDESDQHKSAHDTFTTLEKASYEPTVPEKDNEYSENDSLEPSQKVFEHMVELHPYNHDLEQFIEANSNETVDDIKRKITPETDLAEEVTKKSIDEEKAVEESEYEKEVEAAPQVEHEPTQVEEEKMEIVDEEVHQVQCNNDVANQDLAEPKKESELFQENIKSTNETEIGVQNQTKSEEKEEQIAMVQDGDDKETTSTYAMQLDQPKEEEKEPEAITDKETIEVSEEKLNKPESEPAVLANNEECETGQKDSPAANDEPATPKACSKSISELEADQKSEPELEIEPEIELEPQSESIPKSEIGHKSTSHRKPIEKKIRPARATSSRVSARSISTPVPQKITTTVVSRPLASQKKGRANNYSDNGIKKFICHDCDYSTDRLNNIVYHKKSGCKAFQSYWNQSVESYKKDLIKSPKSNKKRFAR